MKEQMNTKKSSSTSLTKKKKNAPKPRKEKKITVVMEEKEKNWYIPPCTDIPKYRAENDPHCPAAKIRKFNDEQKLKLKEALKNEKKSEKWIKEKLDTKFEDVPLRVNIGLRTKAFEAASSSVNLYPGVAGGAGHHKPALAEVEILQKIIVRERLLTELNRLVRSGSDLIAIMTEVVELIKALRYESVEIIEDIAQWQEQQPTPRPFLFKGVNYLMKITNDLDYLDKHDEIVERFCFEFKQNPLAYRGGGHLISETITRHLSITSQTQSQSQKQAQAMQSEYYLQGLLKSYYDGTMHAAVDGIEVVRLHNAEKIIQRELQRIAQQALIGQDRTHMSFDVSSFQELQQPQFTQSPVLSQQQGHLSPDRAFIPEAHESEKRVERHKAVINPTRMKLERVEKLKEEADELQAMLSHIQEQINTISEQIRDIGKRRKLLEFRFSEAKTQGKEVASQHIAAEILLMNQEMRELQLKVKESQKESYFLTLEKKRKYLVIKKLKDELTQQKQKELLKKKIEEKIKKEGLTAALDAVEDIAMLVKTKTSSKTLRAASKSKKKRKGGSSRLPFDSSQSQLNGENDRLEEQDDEEEEDEGEDGDQDQIQGGNEDEDDDDEEEGDEEEDEEGDTGIEENGDTKNPNDTAIHLADYQPPNGEGYLDYQNDQDNDADDFLSPFQHAVDLNTSNFTENDEEDPEEEDQEEEEDGEGDDGEGEEEEDDEESTNVSHSAGSAFFAAKALRQSQHEHQKDLSS